MNKYLLNTLIFAIVCLVSAFVLDIILSSRLRSNKNRIYAAWNQVYTDTTNYDLIIAGNSRAYVQYDPIIVDSICHINSYNLGNNASPISRQIIKYKKYCDMHQSPKYLIQNIDLWTMALHSGVEREQFYPYFFYDRELINKLDEYEHFSFMEKYFPCYRYLGQEDVIIESLFNDNRQHTFTSLNKGYAGSDNTWDGSSLANTDSVVCLYEQDAIDLFIEFINEVQRDGTQIIFVYAPIYHKVREKMTNEKCMLEMYNTIARRFDIPILDYNDIPMCYDTTYFYNGTHLNKIGAELFTTKLAFDLDSLGFFED